MKVLLVLSMVAVHALAQPSLPSYDGWGYGFAYGPGGGHGFGYGHGPYGFVQTVAFGDRVNNGGYGSSAGLGDQVIANIGIGAPSGLRHKREANYGNGLRAQSYASAQPLVLPALAYGGFNYGIHGVGLRYKREANYGNGLAAPARAYGYALPVHGGLNLGYGLGLGHGLNYGGIYGLHG